MLLKKVENLEKRRIHRIYERSTHTDSSAEKKRKIDEEVTLIKQVAENAKKQINCTIGVRAEKTHVENKKIAHTQRSFSRRIPGTQNRFVLFGKVDGYDTKLNQVIEIKTRKRRLNRRLWPNEFVQVMCYMYMSGALTTKLIEKCGEKSYERVYHFNESEWSDIQGKLQAVRTSMSLIPTL